MSKIILVIGTRPELIKIAPIVHAFKKAKKEHLITVLSTAQHKDMLEKYWDIFNIRPDYELDFMKKGQSLGQLTSRAFSQVDTFFNELEKNNDLPEYVVVQGDTTTVFSVGLSAFYRGIKVAHIEAGLRTYDLQNPFPEEFNRRSVSIIADINFAPTTLSESNLKKEGVADNKIHTVGNTVVDALQYIKSNKTFNTNNFSEIKLNKANLEKGNVVLITFHRRENQNENLLQLISAIKKLSINFKFLNFIWALHPNPKIKKHVLNSDLINLQNVILVPPLDYLDILKLMSYSKIIMSDSGGIQEEAPSFGVPVIVLREITERPEGVIAKKAFLTNVNEFDIITKFENLYSNYNTTNTSNPYGDGEAACKIKKILLSNLK